jgi:IclR family acetate operon transcriptional repressor
MTDVVGLLEELKAIKAQGFATDAEEFMDGMVAMAVPITDESGRLLSTLSIHAPIQRLSLANLRSHLPLMQDTAQKLAKLVLED